LYTKLAAKASAEREVTDPILHKLHEVEKHTVESVSQELFNKPVAELSPKQQAEVVTKRLELTDEAAHELPVHVPELNLAETQHTNAQEAAGNPILARNLAKAKELFPGIDTDQVVSDNQVSDIAKQTGIIDSNNTARRVAKVRDVVTAKEKKISSEAFASHRVDTLQYFKNQYNAGLRRAADGTLIGGRSKLTWNERLKRENTEQFVQTLKEADGNKIKFENPYHRMLFHWSNRASLPAEVKDKLLREMKKISERQGRMNMRAEDFSKEADKALIHLHLLAKGGQLTSERNVFASTKTGAGAFSQWQLQLQNEVQKEELKMLSRIVTRHPSGRKTLISIMKMLQAQRFLSNDAEQWLNYDRAINNFITNRGKVGN
jgi:hypothetical protein